MDVEKILKHLVRIGTVTVTDPVKRVARVKFEDTGQTSGLLYVLASRPYIPDYDVPQRTEFEAGGSSDPAFASHKHDLIIKPWMPKVNAVVWMGTASSWGRSGHWASSNSGQTNDRKEAAEWQSSAVWGT